MHGERQVEQQRDVSGERRALMAFGGLTVESAAAIELSQGTKYLRKIVREGKVWTYVPRLEA